MARMGGGKSARAHARSHPRRRFLFMTLLLLTLLAPAGWAFAGEMTAPYVVIFDPAAVSVPDDTIDTSAGSAPSFRFLAAPPTLRAATMAATQTTISGGNTRVDQTRVESAI